MYSRLAQQRSYSSRMFSINVKAVEGRKLVEPTFSFAPEGDGSETTITAQWAELDSDLIANTLTLVCHDSTIDAGGLSAVRPGTMPWVIPLDEPGKNGSRLSPQDIPLSQIPQAVQSQREHNEARSRRWPSTRPTR